MNGINSEQRATSVVSLELPDTITSTESIVKNANEISENPISQPYQEMSFTEKELAHILDASKKIDITNSELVLQYAAPVQRKIASFSDTTLERVRTKDAGAVGEMLTSLIDELNGFSAEDTNFLGKSARKIRKIIKSLHTRYSKVSTNIDSIVRILEEHQLSLMQDISTLNELYKRNQRYFKEISMYIMAGQTRLDEVRTTKLTELHEIAKRTNDPIATQSYNDFLNACNRFEKKLFDLKLSREVSLQLSAQIRLLQNSDTTLLDKIKSIIVNTIPLWKNQMVIALGIANATSAMKAHRAVTNMTNRMLRLNAQNLKTATTEMARESERGIIDIETLTRTNQMLIDTITEVQAIQAEGQEKRKSAETELVLIESELKEKLLKN